MGANKPDINFLGIERDDGYQAIGIPFDIENKTVISYILNGVKILFDIT